MTGPTWTRSREIPVRKRKVIGENGVDYSFFYFKIPRIWESKLKPGVVASITVELYADSTPIQEEVNQEE